MEQLKNIAFLGTFLPRKCGIATFTNDLLKAVSEHSDNFNCWVIAMNDKKIEYQYTNHVKLCIDQNNINDYLNVANYLNTSNINVLCVQHEFGIFGGKDGQFILNILEIIHIPIVTTLHTVLDEPNENQKRILIKISKLSNKLVVMTYKAKELLREIYDIEEKKIEVIYHGIPKFSFVDSVLYKEPLGLDENIVMITFGLLSKNKGIEYAIKALPKVVEKYPNFIFIILGATHPAVIKKVGEEYRQFLKNTVKSCGVEKHVKFFNHFVNDKELVDFLSLADIYISPYLSEKQITSGTLSLAMGSGKPVISTKYWHAVEFIKDNKRGILVDFKNSEQIEKAILNLLSNEKEKNRIRKNAYLFLKNSTWENISLQYLNLFKKVVKEGIIHKNKKSELLKLDTFEVPNINLKHFYNLVDDIGIFQHCNYEIPDYNHGYCVDDVSRALNVCILAINFDFEDEETIKKIKDKSLSFIQYSYNKSLKTFRNFMNFDRTWIEEEGSEDSIGRTFEALCNCTVNSKINPHSLLSTSLLINTIDRVSNLNHYKAISYVLIGLNIYLTKHNENFLFKQKRNQLAEKLFNLFNENKNENNDWLWIDNELTYSCVKIPQALILSGHYMERDDMFQLGKKILDWLIKIQLNEECFSFIGNNGWYKKGNEKENFDQQPIEANNMIEVCLTMYKITNDKTYAEYAELAFQWYLGTNVLKEPIYDYSTGGCRDGLQPNYVNQNQGAESTLSWLSSLILMHYYKSGYIPIQLIC